MFPLSLQFKIKLKFELITLKLELSTLLIFFPYILNIKTIHSLNAAIKRYYTQAWPLMCLPREQYSCVSLSTVH